MDLAKLKEEIASGFVLKYTDLSELVALVERQEAELAAARSETPQKAALQRLADSAQEMGEYGAPVEQADALTDERAVAMFHDEFGLQQFEDIADQQIVNFVGRVIAATRQAGPVQKDFDASYRAQYEMLGRIATKDAALVTAEAALADIGDSDREPGDDVAWCERRAAEVLPKVRAAMTVAKAAPVQAAPDGWDIRIADDCIIVQKPGIGGYAARRDDSEIASAILWHLANDMLAAAPAPRSAK